MCSTPVTVLCPADGGAGLQPSQYTGTLQIRRENQTNESFFGSFFSKKELLF
jgi:hypothetical protein